MRREPGEAGFTLVELIMTVTIIGIITLPLGNFMLSYLRNVPTSQSRISDSHDMQIAAAYVSNDVASTGVHTSYTSVSATGQSVWVQGALPAAPYCGQSAGTTVLMLSWNTWSVAGNGAGTFGPVSSVAYANAAGTLHRVYCATGASTTTDATLVHGLSAATVTCATSCTAATPPSAVTLNLTIATDSTDTAGATVALTGRRRQS